jgi:hypothetical protein
MTSADPSTAPGQKRRTRVLVFPCGAEPASEIHQALRYSLHVELFGASSVDDHGRFRFENYHGGLPRVDDPAFDAAFAELITRLEIDLVFPTHDTVCAYLAPRAAAMGFHLVNGDERTARICRRKSATYALFADAPWAPDVYGDVDAVNAWPAIVKPDLGQGGQGVTRVSDSAEARAAMASMSDPLLVEYLPGEELTIDCFTDRHGRVLWAGPRTRERVRAGISMRSRMLDPTPEIAAIAETINDRLTFRGPWFFQLKQDGDGEWKLLEVACRTAGAMTAQRARGINLPLMAVQDFLGRDLLTLPEPRVRLIDRRIATAAELEHDYEDVFVDLDDTLIIDSQVTPSVIAFLYQQKARGKRIVLITRHAHDFAATLEQACLPTRLFDDVVRITDGSPKSAHMSERAIFIDNHFPERLAVSTALGIPALDVDMLEYFIR